MKNNKQLENSIMQKMVETPNYTMKDTSLDEIYAYWSKIWMPLCDQDGKFYENANGDLAGITLGDFPCMEKYKEIIGKWSNEPNVMRKKIQKLIERIFAQGITENPGLFNTLKRWITDGRITTVSFSEQQAEKLKTNCIIHFRGNILLDIMLPEFLRQFDKISNQEKTALKTKNSEKNNNQRILATSIRTRHLISQL